MNKYLQLFRIQNAAIGLIGLLVTSFVVAGDSLGNYWMELIIGCVTVVLFICGGNALNDYIDRDIDKVSHPERPLPSGRMEPKIALYLGVVCLLASFVVMCIGKDFNVQHDIVAIAITAVACILMFCYELSFKKLPLIGNITIAIMTGMVFLLGNAIIGDIEAKCVILAGMATLVSVGRELTKDIEDVEGDEGRTTLPMVIGLKKSAVIAAIFYIAGPLLSIVPIIDKSFNMLYFLVIIADVIFVYCAYLVFSDPHKSQKMAKIAMLVALISFVLGALNISDLQMNW